MSDGDSGAPACRPVVRDVEGEKLALAMLTTADGVLLGVAEIDPVLALLLAEELVAAARRRIVEAGVARARSGG